MSYARFSKECSVYVIATKYGDERVIECCGCALSPADFPYFPTIAGMLDHLETHEKVGHKVPAYVSEGIKADTWLGPWLEGNES